MAASCWTHNQTQRVSRSKSPKSGAIAPVVVVIVHVGRTGNALVKKDHRLMGRDFKALLTGLTDYIIIHSDEVIS